MIPAYIVARIKQEARIEEVVGEFVTLKKRGSSLLGLCPFHNEKTPSFNVSVSRGIYKCFGCGKAGDSTNFLMESQQMTYVEALKYLAKKYNIEVIEEEQTEEKKQAEAARQSQLESLYIVNAFAQRFFTDYMLQNEDGKVGLAYFRERGFSQQTIERFQLGYAPDSGKALTDAALKLGYQLELLKKAGLTSPKENSTYDFFRNRVMFPIHNVVGKVVAFGGRIMVKDEKVPKYINTAENELYSKSKMLYGIWQAKNDIRKQDECLLVEGYTDVLSLAQAGIDNVVASGGTSLTVDQIKLIKRYTSNVTILYDGDAAGIKATLRGTDMVLEEGMAVRIVLLPDQEDPDSYVRKIGATAFGDYVRAQRKDLILFKTSLFAEEAKNDPIKKATLLHDLVQSIAKVPDAIQRSIYIKECALIMDMAEQLLITEVNKIRRGLLKEKYKEDVSPRPSIAEMEAELAVHKQLDQQQVNPMESIERDLARLLMECGIWEIYIDENTSEPVTKFVLEDLEGVEFVSPYKMVLDVVRQDFNAGVIHDTDFFLHHEQENIASIARDLLISKYELSDGWWKKFEVYVPGRKETFLKEILAVNTRIKLLKTQEQIKQLETRLSTETDEEKKRELLHQHMLLNKLKLEFAKANGTNVLTGLG